MRDGSSPESRIYLENENAAVEGLNAKVEEECGAEEVKRTRSEVWANICPPDVFFLAMSVLTREGTRGPHEAWPHNTTQHNTAQHNQHNKQNATRKEISKGQPA
jgi:hypothetical protein